MKFELEVGENVKWNTEVMLTLTEVVCVCVCVWWCLCLHLKESVKLCVK